MIFYVLQKSKLIFRLTIIWPTKETRSNVKFQQMLHFKFLTSFWKVNSRWTTKWWVAVAYVVEMQSDQFNLFSLLFAEFSLWSLVEFVTRMNRSTNEKDSTSESERSFDFIISRCFLLFSNKMLVKLFILLPVFMLFFPLLFRILLPCSLIA